MPTVIVRPGDTLWDLAAKYLGSGSRWKELGFTGDPRKLPIGTKLTWGEPAKKTTTTKTTTTKPKSSIVDQYSKGGVESAPSPNIPLAENVLSWNTFQQQQMPSLLAFGQQIVAPEIQRNLNRDMNEYLLGMANVGGGRFGRAWGGTGRLGSEASRESQYQTQLWANQGLNEMYKPIYDQWAKQWNKAKEAGNVYGDIQVPSVEEAILRNPQIPGYMDYVKGATGNTGQVGYGNRSLFQPMA